MAKLSKKQAPLPRSISPMLATLVKEPPADPAYLYEIKWDGYRIISYVQKGKVRMDSRSGLDYTSKYPPVKAALSALKHDLVIDGEVVVFNEEGRPDFDALQKYNGHSSAIYYCVFDLLWLDGENLMGLPLTARKARLQQLIAGHDQLRFSESFDDGQELYDRVLGLNLEGIIAKKRDSPYLEGDRSYNWLKIPTRKRQEFVIGAWAESDRGRSFRSLLFGAYNKTGALEWIGRSGGGYKEQEMPAILKKLKALEIDRSPFINKILDNKGAMLHYVKPLLVANFEFATWTKSGRIRKPATFLGFRNDKNAKDVVLEVPRKLPEASPGKRAALHTGQSADLTPVVKELLSKAKQRYLNADSNWKAVDKEQEGAEWLDLGLKNCNTRVHNIDRELWPGIPKIQLITYYNEIAHLILPYLKDRPQTLALKLSDHKARRYFIKDMENRQPECSTVFSDERRSKETGKRNQIDYLVCNNKETLLYMIDLGCVDLNPWASKFQQPDHPDQIWLDLDPTIDPELPENKRRPAEAAGFKKAIKVALAAKEILNAYGLRTFVKTSGQTGIHIYIPCQEFTFEQSYVAATRLANAIHDIEPKISTRERSKENRGNRVYIDADQNHYSKTLAAPYSIRPYDWPLVSTPLEWDEVNGNLDRKAFNIDTILDRVRQKGDLFRHLLSPSNQKTNTKILRKLL